MNRQFISSAYPRHYVHRRSIITRVLPTLGGCLGRIRRGGTLAAVLSLVVPFAAFAQSTTPAARIATQINESSMTTLRGNMHPLALSQFDQGKADPGTVLGRVTMFFQRTAAQQADLDALLAAQQNPTSPSFHQWLTPTQYGDRFGVAQADVAKVTAWLQSHGLIVTETPASKNLIVFSGTAAQVGSAFHTEIHSYATNDRKFYANSAEPSVPSALAAIVSGFRGLNNYPLKPRSIRKNPLSGVPQPNFTSATSGNHFVAPGDFAKIYDVNPLYSAGTAIDATGQTIVIVGQSNIVLADIASFRSASGLAAKAPVVTLVPGSTDPGVLNTSGDEQESSLDIEWAGAIAKNATIKFVYSSNVGDALQYAISQNLAPIISTSYSSCEALNSSSDLDNLAALAQQANAMGITIVAASGDGGATDCDFDFANYPAALGLSVSVPASLPYVTAIGGTEFNDASGTYWQTASGTDVITSALSYIPEQVWNDSQQQLQLAAGGGGASSVFGKPTWQTGLGVPADGFRDVPDISLNASSGHDSYLVCVQFTPQNSSTYTSSCVNNTFRYSDNSVEAYGGTSFGAPVFAGILALINQKTGSAGQGNINYILYPLAASSSTAFHDIVNGNNASPCQTGSQDCPNGGSIGYSAGTGYDQASGLGSVDVAILANAWTSISAGASGSTPTLSTISPTSATAGSGAFILTATGSNFATNAQILWNGSTDGVTMLPGGTSTTIRATISPALVAYGTTASITVTDDASKAGESSASETFTVNGTLPANDNIANAIAITVGNFTSTVDNSAATTESTDPNPLCALMGPAPSTNARTKTVWWSLQSASSETVNVSTIGSVYDTTLSVWTGTPGSLSNVACNDDIIPGQYRQSSLMFLAVAGTKYYVMVAPFGPPDPAADQAGGKTVLNVSVINAGPSPLSGSPSSQTVAAGGSATYTITNSGNVSYTLTCIGLPTGATCGAATVSAGGSTSLVITTTSRTAVLPPLATKWPLHIDLGPATLDVFGVLLLGLWALRKRRLVGLAPLGALAILLVFFGTGCGSSVGNSGGGGGVVRKTNPNGTPAGTYTITVSGSGTVATTVTLIVT